MGTVSKITTVTLIIMEFFISIGYPIIFYLLHKELE